jgi:hypothetical protein
MSDRVESREQINRAQGADTRRRQLRALLLSAADAARQTRRGPLTLVRQDGSGRAARDRITKPLSAAS